MKKLISIIFTLALLFPAFSQTQDNRTLETKIADILAQIPANDIAYRNKLLNEFIGLGNEGFQKLTTMLKVPGAGNDAAARMLINSTTRYFSTRNVHDQEKIWIEQNLLTAIKQSKEKAIQRFLIQQLDLVGGCLSVLSMKPYLQDAELCEPATRALLSIRTEKAKETLLEALIASQPNGNATLIKALGELQFKPAVPLITKYVGSKNTTLQRVTLQALAGIGDPASYKTLWNVASLTPQYEPTMTVSSFITYLDRLGEEKELILCKKGVLAILKKYKKPDQLHYRAAALKVYASHFGEESLPVFYKEVKNKNKDYRTALLVTATYMGNESVTKKWISIAEKSDPEIRTDILRMLGHRGDKIAVSFVKEQLSDKDGVVRTEAMEALAALEGKKVVPALLDHLSGGKDIDETERLLLTYLSKEDLPAVAEMIKKSNGKAKAACINILKAREGTSYFPMIRDLCTSEDKIVRDAAYRALQGVATASYLNDLIPLLLKADDSAQVAGVQQAIVAAINDADNKEPVIHRLIGMLSKTNKKERLIEVLPLLGGEEALKSVADLFYTSEGSIRQAALQALVKWKDSMAAGVLFTICQNGPKSSHPEAFKGFVRQIEQSKYPSDQKLLQFRNIMPYANNKQEKLSVIHAVGQLRTFPAIVFLGKFVDDPDLQQEAASSIISVALPTSGGAPGFSGKIVHELLYKSLENLKGPESDYQKEQVRHYLEIMSQEEGYVSMFNGIDLSGWKGFVADPVKLAKMSKRELQKKQIEADRKMHENWSVNKGSIVFNGKGDNLVSEKIYGNFEMWVDWRITKGGDSGIYLRSTPQVQIWDTSRRNVGAQVGSGGLYNNRRNRSTPLKVADNPVGEWNTFHITMVDSIVTVWLNGEQVVDHLPLENYWDHSRLIFPTGTIELQAHGSNLAFRDIYIREIPDIEYKLSREEKTTGFKALFNGKNLSGWVGNKIDYIVEDGNIVIRPKEGSHGNLYTEKEYRNFIFRFEFKLTPGANNGIGIRAPLTGDAAYVGMEIQVLDNTASVYAHLQPYQYHGSVYGVIPAKRGYLKPVGEWNSEEISANGSKIKVTLNGTVIVDGDILEASKKGTMDHKNHSGLLREKGHIGFLGHGSVVSFRNIRIKEM